MKNLMTTDEIRKKYNPDAILNDIEKYHEKHFEKLVSSISHPDCPLSNYSIDKQISFLESEKKNDDIIKQVTFLLKDTIYFMILSKTERTNVTQKMRSYYSAVINNQLLRIQLLLDDREIGAPKHFFDSNAKHKGMEKVFTILDMLNTILSKENTYRKQLARSGYLTGLQISMGHFFVFLKKIGMSQKDQITFVQYLFDDFNVDWEAGDRENIKLSLQQPALEYFKSTQKEIQAISSTIFSSNINQLIVENLIDHAILLIKRIRRF
tara:strand:- start:132 stop:929 length:798 start_codon:yes stop_codon:yes gene_type:complete